MLLFPAPCPFLAVSLLPAISVNFLAVSHFISVLTFPIQWNLDNPCKLPHNLLLLDQARASRASSGMFALLVGVRLPHQSALEQSGQTAVTVAPFDAEKTLGIEGLCREDGGKVSRSDGESCCQVKPGRFGAQSILATGLRQRF